MRIISTIATAGWACTASLACWAHGPQIQITQAGGQIVTHELFLEAPYTAPSPPKSVYVMPVLPTSGVWYARPSGAISPLTSTLLYPSGPGLAYGSDLADGGPQDFAAGSAISLGFLDGLKRWDGASAAFVDAGDTQLKAFRGSNENIDTPPENFAITSDAGPFDSVLLAAVADGYGSDGAGVHGSFRYAFLGDGVSPAVAPADGVYLFTMQVSTTQSGVGPSDALNFVLHKNAGGAELSAAVASLHVAPGLVQVVPEPLSLPLASVASCLIFAMPLRLRERR